MEKFKSLSKKKEEIENEIESIVNELNTGPNSPGLKGNLIDKDGYPRADIDIYNIRLKRNRYAILQTDHGNVMKEIEKTMQEIYANAKP